MEDISTTTNTVTHPKQKLKKRGPRRHYERRFPVRLKPAEIDLLKLKSTPGRHVPFSVRRP